MTKYSLQFAIFYSINYLILMFFLFGLLAFPSPRYDGMKLQLCLIFVQAVVLVVLSFVGG